MRLLPLFAAFAALVLIGASAAEIGRVKLASGAAFVERGKARLPARAGLVLMKGDRLVTGRDGRIGVTFVDNSRFAAGPGSRIALDEFAFDPTTHDGRFVTRIDRGSLAVVSGQIARRNKDAMRVRTPTALLGVRGTRFAISVK